MARSASVALLLLAVGPAEPQTDRPASAPKCPPAPAWYVMTTGTPRPVAGADVLADAARRDVVLLGEDHNATDHHSWQLQTLAALHVLRPHIVLGFESFPRRVQPALDKWVAGELTVRQFLEQSDWNNVWGAPLELYLPLFQFARINRVPMRALNVERSLTQAVAEKGWDAVPVAQREGVSRPVPASPAYRESLFEVYREHPRNGRRKETVTRDDPDFGFFVESQITWDRAMAEALAQPLKTGGTAGKPLVVGIAGAGHVRSGYGIPHQLRDLGFTQVATLLPVAPEECGELQRNVADAVFALPGKPREPAAPPRLGVLLAESKERVTITEVTAGSLAEKSGLRPGDRIVALGGAPMTRSISVVSAVRLQPPGTWLPLQIERGSEKLDLVIKFPPAK